MRLALLLILGLTAYAQSVVSGNAVASGNAIVGYQLGPFPLVQHSYQYCGARAGGSACTLTATATTAGNLLILAVGSEDTSSGMVPTLSSVSGDGTWTHPSGCYGAGVHLGLNLTTDCAYILSATGGATSFSWTWTQNVLDTYIELLEVSRPSGSWSLDVVGTPLFSVCSSCTAPALSLTGVLDYVAQWAVPWNILIAISGGSGYGTPQDFQTMGNFAVAGANTASGAAPIWLQPGTAHGASMSAIAFK